MDLIILGGGPAGTSAALTARKAGADVTILEERPFPRFRPGETVHPGIEPLLTQLGAEGLVASGSYVRHPGTWVEWGDSRHFLPFGQDANGPWSGFQIPRADLDGHLLELARQRGVEVRQPLAARDVILSGRSVAGIQTDAGPLRAALILDASGSRHWLARRLRIPIPPRSPRLVARYAYRSDPPSRLDQLPRISADATGWTWIADLGESRYTWTRLTEPDTRPGIGWAPPDWPDGRAQFSGGADVTWRIASRTAGPGWFLCGDAAMVLDPSSSHGVLRAIMTGMLAAHYSIAILSAEVPQSRVTTAYGDWLDRWFHHDSQMMAKSYHEARLFGF